MDLDCLFGGVEVNERTVFIHQNLNLPREGECKQEKNSRQEAILAFSPLFLTHLLDVSIFAKERANVTLNDFVRDVSHPKVAARISRI